MILREFFIARTVLIEAVRRKEIYVVVLLSCVLIGTVTAMDFFNLEGLTKFYREFALKVMSAGTAIATIILACRQLPREFEQKTIYPLLARPISRSRILLGKFVGVWLASVFCLGIFILIFTLGMAHLGGDLHWPIFLQYVYLQMLMMLVLTSLGFALSMICNVDASITLGMILYLMGATFSTMMNYMYDMASALGQWGMVILTYLIPQLFLFDLSEKAVHAEAWQPLAAMTMVKLSLYALVYIIVFITTSILLFRKRPI